MNRWTKSNVIATIKERASFNARHLVKNVHLAQEHAYSTQEADEGRRMAQLYMHQLNEDLDVLYAFGYIDFDRHEQMENSVWEYYRRVYR